MQQPQSKNSAQKGARAVLQGKADAEAGRVWLRLSPEDLNDWVVGEQELNRLAFTVDLLQDSERTDHEGQKS